MKLIYNKKILTICSKTEITQKSHRLALKTFLTVLRLQEKHMSSQIDMIKTLF